MTEPGYVPPPQPGWWARKDRVGIAQTVTDFETSAAGYRPKHFFKRSQQMPNGKVGPMALRNKFRRRPLRNPARIDPLFTPRFYSKGAGSTALATTRSFSHTIDTGVNAVVLLMNCWGGFAAATPPTYTTVTFGGVPMSLLGAVYVSNDGTNWGWSFIYGLLNPPVGTQTVTVTGPNTYMTVNTYGYRNVAGWGSLGVSDYMYNGAGGTSVSYTTPSPTDTKTVVAGFFGYTQVWSNATPNHRENRPYVAGQGLVMVVGDGEGILGSTVGATHPSGTNFGFSVELMATIPTYTTPTYVGTGLGTTGLSGRQTPGYTWTEIVPSDANCAVLWISELPTAIPKTCTVTMGGTSMVEMTGSPWTFDSSSNWNRMRGFYLLNPPTGPQSVAITSSTNNYFHAETVYYGGVTSVAPVQPAWGPGSTDPAITIPSSQSGHMYAIGMSHRSVNASSTFSTFGDGQSATVATARTLNFDTWNDLTDITDAVTFTVDSTGTAVVSFYAEVAYAAGSYGTPGMTFELSGANTMAASDTYSAVEGPANYIIGSFTLTGLTPGSTTFKLKYRRVGGGTGQWNLSSRKISVRSVARPTMRAVRSNATGSTNPLVAGDAAGTGSALTVSASRVGTTYPWAATAVDLSPSALPTPSVPTWVGTGVAYPHFTGSVSYTETVPANANCAVLIMSALGSTAITASLGGSSMTAITPISVDAIGYTLQAFYLMNPSTGANKTLSITNTNPNYVQTSMIYYGGVTSVGSVTSLANQTAAAAAISVSSTLNHMYVNGLAFRPNAADNRFITYDQTLRYVGRNDANDVPILTGDAVGTGSTLTFNATRNNTASQWGGFILDLA